MPRALLGKENGMENENDEITHVSPWMKHSNLLHLKIFIDDSVRLFMNKIMWQQSQIMNNQNHAKYQSEKLDHWLIQRVPVRPRQPGWTVPGCEHLWISFHTLGLLLGCCAHTTSLVCRPFSWYLVCPQDTVATALVNAPLYLTQVWRQ